MFPLYITQYNKIMWYKLWLIIHPWFEGGTTIFYHRRWWRVDKSFRLFERPTVTKLGEWTKGDPNDWQWDNIVFIKGWHNNVDIPLVLMSRISWLKTNGWVLVFVYSIDFLRVENMRILSSDYYFGTFKGLKFIDMSP